MTCVVPEILISDRPWVRTWNLFIIVFCLIYCFIAPYCLAFGDFNEFEHLMCSTEGLFRLPFLIIFAADVAVEILAACPVYGERLVYFFHLCMMRI